MRFRQHDWRRASYGKYECARCTVLRWEVIDSHTKARRLLYEWPWTNKRPLWSTERPECVGEMVDEDDEP